MNIFPVDSEQFDRDAVITDQSRLEDNINHHVSTSSAPMATPRASTITNILRQSEQLRYQASDDAYQPFYPQYSSPYESPYIHTPSVYFTPNPPQTVSINFNPYRQLDSLTPQRVFQQNSSYLSNNSENPSNSLQTSSPLSLDAALSIIQNTINSEA